MQNTIKVNSNRACGENWKVYHPEGKHMFTTSKKRVEWYLKRDLANVTGKNKITLTFNPKGKGYNENDVFGLSDLHRKCVVSGETDITKLQRHHIIPTMYRKHLPLEYKSKNRHDVVFIRYDLHEYYERYSDEYKDIISDKYGILSYSDLNLINSKRLSDFTKNEGKIMNICYTFLHKVNTVPIERQLQLAEIICRYENVDLTNLTKEFFNEKFNEYSKLLRNLKKNSMIDHGKMLIDQIDNYEEFIIGWRKHFIETMNPLYMPNGWDIYSRCKVEL
jgi:exonuclease 3'-5' domain-containing protein 2